MSDNQDYTKGLNPAQRDAVVNYEGSSLIVAGAGSGKTRVLTCRIAHMLSKGVAPQSILALTFTNKAAREMRERIAAMVEPALSRRLWMGTFHSIFARILRAEAAVMGYPATFTIYDTADSRNLIRRIIKEMSLPEENYKPGDILSRISLAKNNLVTPEAYRANTTLTEEDLRQKKPLMSDIYAAYAKKCREYGAMDFDDLLLNINILLRDHPQVLAKYQALFQYILVDEYQDTNYAQYVIIRRLAQTHSRVCVVGDDAQSIYSFRGAKIENILRFRNDFPEASTFKLEQNYRSTRTIVSAANSLIEKNENRIKKDVFSEGPTGEKIKVIKAYTDQEEASLIADELRGLVRNGGHWGETAILYRTNAQSRVLEEALRRRGIPYKIYGGTSFFQRKEVKDLVAYIRLVANPRDEESLRRVINFPARGIGEVTLDRLAAAAATAGAGIIEAIRTLDLTAAGLNAGAATKVREFAAMLDELSLKREQLGLYDLGLEISTRSGLIGIYKNDSSPESMSALENIEEVLNSLQTFADDFAEQDGQPLEPSIDDWLQNIALLTDADSEENADNDHVTLMTVHSAKGLEFRHVVIAGLEENLFPNMMGMGTPEGLEEERRLFYVAITRARETAVLTFAEQRFKWGQMTFSRPSRFLSEIDRQYLAADFEIEDTRPNAVAPEDPIAALRQRFDYRQKQSAGQNGSQASQYGSTPRQGRPQGSSGSAAKPYASPAAAQRPAPAMVRPTPVDAGMKSIGRRPARTDDSLGGNPAAGVPPSGSAATSGAITPGTRVRHRTFGEGTVRAAEIFSGDMKYTIEFDKEGSRTLLHKFAKLEVL